MAGDPELCDAVLPWPIGIVFARGPARFNYVARARSARRRETS